MTWIVAWVDHNGPGSETAPTEAAAVLKARRLVDSRRARHATCYEIDDIEETA